MKITRKQLRKIIAEVMTPAGDVETPSELEQHVFPSKHSKDPDYYDIETIIMTVGKLMPEGFTVNDVFDHIYKNKLDPYTKMSFDELHQVMVGMARDKILEGYEDFFMLMPDFL
jgi:hypothetical protein